MSYLCWPVWLLVLVRNGWWGFIVLPQRLARNTGSEPRISVTWDNILLFSVGEIIITMIIIINTILTMIISMIMIINTILIMIMVMIIIMVMVSQF